MGDNWEQLSQDITNAVKGLLESVGVPESKAKTIELGAPDSGHNFLRITTRDGETYETPWKWKR